MAKKSNKSKGLKMIMTTSLVVIAASTVSTAHKSSANINTVKPSVTANRGTGTAGTNLRNASASSGVRSGLTTNTNTGNNTTGNPGKLKRMWLSFKGIFTGNNTNKSKLNRNNENNNSDTILNTNDNNTVNTPVNTATESSNNPSKGGSKGLKGKFLAFFRRGNEKSNNKTENNNGIDNPAFENTGDPTTHIYDTPPNDSEINDPGLYGIVTLPIDNEDDNIPNPYGGYWGNNTTVHDFSRNGDDDRGIKRFRFRTFKDTNDDPIDISPNREPDKKIKTGKRVVFADVHSSDEDSPKPERKGRAGRTRVRPSSPPPPPPPPPKPERNSSLASGGNVNIRGFLPRDPKPDNPHPGKPGRVSVTRNLKVTSSGKFIIIDPDGNKHVQFKPVVSTVIKYDKYGNKIKPVVPQKPTADYIDKILRNRQK